MLDRRVFRLRTAAVVALTGGAAWGLGVGVVVLGARRFKRGAAVEARLPVLVLGCRPGPGFARRLDAAADLYANGRAEAVVVSGRGEADWGVARLVEAGLPAGAVLREPDARNTWENLTLSRPYLGERPFYLVSDAFHLPRATMAARTLGMSPVPHAVVGPERPPAYLREGLSVVMSVAGGHVPLRAWLSVLDD